MPIDLEAEYNNRARVPEHPALIAAWQSNAEAYSAEAGKRLKTLNYGPTPRQSIDLFEAAKPDAHALPVLFIHGGYWQGLDRSFFSHMAKGLNAHGINVGIAGYDLCPDVSIGDIIEQMILAARAVHKRFKQPVVATGHSAGGHLAACLAATDWESIDARLPLRLIPAGLAISGLFELEPLVPTTVNHKLGLDIMAARSYSPRLWAPPSGVTFDAWVGGKESPEYLRQSAGLNAVWTAAGNAMRYVEVPGANHFTVIAGLADPDSAMTRRLAEMAATSGSP
jgi:arylformamidase